MHVDWRWIKQRPHYLAECLAERHDVAVLYRPSGRRRTFPHNPSPVERKPLAFVPRVAREAFPALDARLQRRVVRNATAARGLPDLIWATFPTLLSYVPPQMATIPVAYDCMDDALAFRASTRSRDEIARWEAIAARAAFVFASSATLAARLVDRYPGTTPHLVRNGVPAELLASMDAPDPVGTPDALRRTNPCDVGYVGTIADWFDFEAVLASLEAIPDLRVHLVGPSDVDIPRHARLIAHGAVEHPRLQPFVSSWHACLMPFRRTTLVEAVDPVKLYEYLAWDKVTIARHYPEIERFAPYVHFYETPAELVVRLRGVRDGHVARRASRAAVRAFLEDNTWAARARRIDAILGGRAPVTVP